MTEETPLADIDALTSEHSENMPEVQQHVIDSEIEEEKQAAEEYSDLRDRHGMPFDAALHVTDSGGKPLLTKTGKLRVKAGRKAGGTNSQVGGAVTPQMSEDEKQKRDRYAAAHAVTMMTEQIGVALGGEKARFIRQSEINEEENVFSAYEKYFEHKGISDFPVGVALVIALGGYGMRVSLQTPAKDKAKGMWYFAKSKLSSIFKRGKKHAAFIDSGDDRERENDASEANGDAVQSTRRANPTT